MSAGHLKFNWVEYIDLAEVLLQDIPEGEDDECKARCGISRAYYGAYHGAADYLCRAKIKFNIYGQGSHDNVINEFCRLGQSGDKAFRFVYKKLSELKKLRNKADYEDVFFGRYEALSEGSLRKKLKCVIDDADKILKTIKEIEEKEASEK